MSQEKRDTAPDGRPPRPAPRRHIRTSAYYEELIQTRARDRGISYSEAIRQLIEEAHSGRSAFRGAAIRMQASWIKERASIVAKRCGGDLIGDMAYIIQCAEKVGELA